MMTSLHNIVILGAQDLLMLTVSKFLIKMTKPQNIVLCILMFCGMVIFTKNSDLINIRRPWAPNITMFCLELVMTKIFNLSIIGGLGSPLWFHIFFNQSFLVLGRSFFTPGVFSLDSHGQQKALWKSRPVDNSQWSDEHVI